MTSTNPADDITNRSEIVFLYDAEDANPNGNPLSANDKPRIDEDTRRAIVTDVRLKRYLRDQLYDDDNGVYIRNPSKTRQGVGSRDDLFLSLLDVDANDLDEMDADDLFTTFLDSAADVRYFGATLSFSEQVDDELDSSVIPQYTGPLQFSHGRSLNRVVENDESKKLSTVVASDDEADQGTFAEDNRLEYALIRFHGVLNEVAAANTRLSPDDVERLDTLCWRALKNQTLTRSKMGHNPRLYLRVEFDAGYHEGDLDSFVTIDRDTSAPDREMRNISDVTIDVSDLLDRLSERADRIDTVHVKASQYATFTNGDDTGDAEFLYDELSGVVDTHIIDIYNE